MRKENHDKNQETIILTLLILNSYLQRREYLGQILRDIPTQLL
jgi:hypothetical protein